MIEVVQIAPTADSKDDTDMSTTLAAEHASKTLPENTGNALTETLAELFARTAPGTRSWLEGTHHTVILPARVDVHRLDELSALCTANISSDLLLDASKVRFVDTAALTFLENLDTARRSIGAAVHYLWPSPALTATFELHGSKLADSELMVR